jgi:hypothetical protein
MTALARLQTIVPVPARGSSSCHFGPPLVLRPDGGVEIVEPDGSAVVVPAVNVASYPKPSAGGEVASPVKPPLSAGGVASPPVEPRRDKGRR